MDRKREKTSINTGQFNISNDHKIFRVQTASSYSSINTDLKKKLGRKIKVLTGKIMP